jgi:hypothetical protein
MAPPHNRCKTRLLVYFLFATRTLQRNGDHHHGVGVCFSGDSLSTGWHLFMVFTKHSQRLGDLVANTVVVRKTKPYSLEDTILKTTDEDYKLTFRNVMMLRDKDIYIIKQVLDDLKKTGDYGNSKELSEKAREILNITEPYKPVELLRIIVKDYNHMARRHDAMQKDT